MPKIAMIGAGSIVFSKTLIMHMLAADPALVIANRLIELIEGAEG